MLIRPQFAKFVGDKEAQKSIAQKTYRSMQEWKNDNFSEEKRQIIAQAGDAITIGKAVEIIKPLLSDISWLYNMVSKLCEIQKDNVFTNIELRSSKNNLVENLLLHKDTKIALYLTIIKKQKNNAHSFSHIFGPDTIINTYVKVDGAHIERAVLNQRGCVERNNIDSRDGQSYVYNNNNESINIIATNDDVILLRSIFKRKHYVNSDDWNSHHYQEFLPHNSKPIITSADETASRAQFMFSILRQSNYKKAIPIFKQWLNENLSYDMRWYIMREFLALDVTEALPFLKQMTTDDPHPQVRRAASSTLIHIRTQYPKLFENENQYATVN